MQRIRDAGLRFPMRLCCCRHGATSLGGDSHETNCDPTLVLDNDELRVMADLYRDAAVDDPLVSPVHADFTGLPPTFITTGTRDLLLSDGVRSQPGCGATAST